MIGIEARLAFEKALALVRAGEFEEARKVQLLSSDREVIEKRISAAWAKRNDRR